jgi:UDP-N-acetylmuramate dehydrogenase
MMVLATSSPHLIDRLPRPRGRLTADAPLGPQTWFRAGGAAEVLFRPADVEDLATFFAAVPPDVPVTVLGVGSNILVRDGGVKGVVIRLLRGFTGISVEDHEIVAGAGALDLNVALTARDHGLAGLEFLSGIPGTIGGALRMNAGAYGGEMSEVLVSAEGSRSPGPPCMSCRRPRWASAIATAKRPRSGSSPGDACAGDAGRPTAAIARRIAEIDAARDRLAAAQPHRRLDLRQSAGPQGVAADRQGRLPRPDASAKRQVSEKHCNFLINTGEATATDIEALGEEVRRRVREQTGVAAANGRSAASANAPGGESGP